MQAPSDAAVRGIVLSIALAAGVYLLLAAALELADRERRCDKAAIRADIAAYHVSELLQEARDITARAALGETP